MLKQLIGLRQLIGLGQLIGLSQLKGLRQLIGLRQLTLTSAVADSVYDPAPVSSLTVCAGLKMHVFYYILLYRNIIFFFSPFLFCKKCSFHFEYWFMLYSNLEGLFLLSIKSRLTQFSPSEPDHHSSRIQIQELDITRSGFRIWSQLFIYFLVTLNLQKLFLICSLIKSLFYVMISTLAYYFEIEQRKGKN